MDDHVLSTKECNLTTGFVNNDGCCTGNLTIRYCHSSYFISNIEYHVISLDGYVQDVAYI